MPIIKEDPMHKYDPSGFQFTSVKGEVEEAMQFDWKRDKVDDAKKRAIHDARSYDDFTARVKGCTLKPIHRNEFNAPPKFSFNRQGAGGAGGDAATPYVKVPTEGGYTAATTALRAGASAADGDICARLFAKELDAEVLRQMLIILEEAASPAEGRRLLKDLALRCPNQTSMASTFLTHEERMIGAKLLARAPASEDEDIRICAALAIPHSAVATAAKCLEGAEAQGQEEPELA
eukprot:CAMPEP_0206522610 /NCGR_PEP_ID=MMETSP0324_2-20121206/67083_1 /ASSEMBLY_ACC=CAM_ASM_000836 /TAXON_ID=2866 /ORGANISM="Crypthecodinium cohnii, Strain Seligo" /LENGTH=233 /DNA_ID=CAMNT_0054016803 /DNA_START=84 /DNA_END=785 /DNA_ORIENTATION=+